MRYKFFRFIVLALLSFQFANGQVNNFILKEWDESIPGSLSFKVNPVSSEVNAGIIKNIEEVLGDFTFKIFSIPIQKQVKGLTKHDVLVCVDRNNKIFILPEIGSHKLTISSFQLITVDSSEAEKHLKDLSIFTSNSIKLIIDSLEIRNTENIIEYVSVAPNVSLMLKYDNLDALIVKSLFFVVKDYYSAQFNIGTKEYEMCLYAHPMVSSILDMPNLYWGKDNFRYIIYKTQNGKRVSFAHWGGNVVDIITTNSAYPCILDNKKILVTVPNNDYSKASMRYMDYKAAIKTSDSLILESLAFKNLQNGNFIYPFKDSLPYKLFYFGGSWCLPCKLVQPELFSMLTKYAKVISPLIIFAENNEQDAKNYLDKEYQKFPTVFQQLSSKNKDFLIDKYNIGAFPSFLLMDGKNKIIMKSNSASGLEKINKYLLEHIP